MGLAVARALALAGREVIVVEAADAIVATVLCDSNKKYLSTDLLRVEREKPGYLSPEVDLSCYEAFRRAR